GAGPCRPRAAPSSSADDSAEEVSLMPEPVLYRGMTLIVPDNDSEWTEFYAHARAHRLVDRACTGCGFMRYPPTHACPWCMALGWTWQELSGRGTRSEEHTSELQSRGHLVCRLL